MAVKVAFNGTDITSLCGKLSISGDLKQVARKLSIEVLKNDKFVPSLGSEISVNGVFSGFIWTLEANADTPINKLTAFSPLIYLTKNVAANSVFNNVPINSIIAALSEESGLSMGAGVTPNNKVTINARKKSIYDVLRAALDELSSQTGKLYHVEYENGKIEILTGGKTASNVISYREDTTAGTIISKTYKDTLDGMVSKVIVMDSTGNASGYVASDYENRYGSISVAVSDKAKASAALKPPKTSINVTILADWTYTTGRAVELESGGVRAHFLIVSDVHYYDGGIHTADLTLERW